ncbi:hypothetical protein SELMODRAFT_420634 [Selaginella moellendorffii]|uniref:Uncharacterized protein n=1 Tax=Selaginella moellendorffii TaxID=88036 RepID=D8SCL9_SELML|nr:hypothetical protein SELMODRAFT_420634 [Selaginella moellendorffii]
MEVEPNNTGMLEFLSPELLGLEEQEAKAGELKQDACLEQSSSTEEGEEADMQPMLKKKKVKKWERTWSNTGKQQREGKSAGLEAEDDMEDQHPDGPGDPLLRSWDSLSHNRQACRTGRPTAVPGIQETREDHLDEEPQNGNANQRPREALREMDEEFRGFVHGDLSGALARRLLWLTVMAVTI